MKNIHFSLVILALSIWLSACKKDKTVASPTAGGSSSTLSVFNIVTANKWLLTHYYTDSVLTSVNSMNYWPLSTSREKLLMTDTCTRTSKFWFKPNNDLYIIKGIGCPSANPDTVKNYAWKLYDNDTKFNFGINTDDSLNVLTINNTCMKLWQKNSVLVGGTSTFVNYSMWVFEPAP